MTEDEEFEDLERRLKPIAEITPTEDKMYTLGWNAALELATAKMVHDLKLSFPKDTLFSFAVYLNQLKK